LDVRQPTAILHRGLPPGPAGTLIGGNIGQVGPRRVDFFLELARTYGQLATFRIGRWRLFLASDPDLIQQVLITDAKHYIKHFGARTFKPVLGNGLVTSEGDFWLRQRRLIQPAFLKARVLSYVPDMIELANAMLERWSPGRSVNVESEFSELTSAIALKTLFGLDAQGDRERLDGSLRLAFDLLTTRLDGPFQIPIWLPTPANLRLRRAIRELTRGVDGYIAAGRARRHPGNDLLSTMIAAQAEDGSQMSDRQLRDEAMTLYLAGHETTALALAWTWYLLSQDPRVEKKLADESAQVSALENDKRQLASGSASAQGEIAKLQKRAAELEGEAARIAKEREQLRQEQTQLSASLDQERQRLKAEGTEKARLEQERAAKEEEIRRLTRTQEELSKSLQDEIAKGNITIQQVRDQLTINMVDRVLFDSGQAQVKPAGLKVLKQVSDVLKKVADKQIRIEGHTDDVPISTKLQDKFKSNWELSTTRATTVVRYLIDQGGVDRQHLSAVGYADTRPQASNETEAGRASNRRIEIVLYPKDLSQIARQDLAGTGSSMH
jgi:flagellar motor protein MotB